MKKRAAKNTDYSPEFRIQACRLVIDEKQAQNVVASNLGVCPKTLNGWLVKFRSGQWNLKTGGTSKGVENVSNPIRSKEELSNERREILELQKQVRRLTMEREILKKAMAYCVDLPK